MKPEPPTLRWVEPWSPVSAEEGVRLAEELRREVCNREHALYGRPAIAVGARRDLDDFLFYLGPTPPSFALVHLTWNRESQKDWPHTELFETAQDWIDRGLRAAVLDYDQAQNSENEGA